MRVTVLGCAGSAPGPDSPASGYLVEAEGYRVVLDLGQGTFGALARHLDPGRVDTIVISHQHPDHCMDLTAYVVALRWGRGGYRRADPLPVIGPPRLAERLATAYDPFATEPGLADLFAFDAPRDGALGPFEVQYARTNHPVPTTAIRLTHGGRSLTYSADTGECAELVRLAQDTDVLLCEASVAPDEPELPGLHLSGAQAGAHASRAGARRLVLTHVPPWNSPAAAADHARTTFDGPLELAVAGASWLV